VKIAGNHGYSARIDSTLFRMVISAGERYKRTGEILPDSAIEELKKFDSMYLCAIGHPDVKPGTLEVGILPKTRFALDQYINLRPVKLCPNVETPLKDKGPEHIDFVVVRENTGGIYTGIGGVTHLGAILPWPKCIRGKMSDKKHYGNYRDLHVSLPLYPGENKPIITGNAAKERR
jgi:isocitrate/isopropylmalate dehydrogenase